MSLSNLSLKHLVHIIMYIANNRDRVCENQSYLHVKFDLILSLSNLITLFPNIASTLTTISSYTLKEFNKTYRYCITNTEKEIAS